MSIDQFVLASQAAFNSRNADAIADLWAEPATYRAPGESGRGLDELGDRERALWTAFPDVEMTVAAIADRGNKGVMRAKLRGTHRGPFNGIEPTGRPVEIDVLAVVTFDDGKVVDEIVHYDRLEILEQLT